MAQRQKNMLSKIAITFLFFEIIQKFFFPLLAKTFVQLLIKNQLDGANMVLGRVPQMICTTFVTPCSSSPLLIQIPSIYFYNNLHADSSELVPPSYDAKRALTITPPCTMVLACT